MFGNMGDDCGTGVCFTRDPSTGENMFYGEYLINAQGEDVVAGIRTPQPLSIAEKKAMSSTCRRWKRCCRRSITQLVTFRDRLEKHYHDMQDMEFTIQKGKLYMLQTRNGKRTGAGGAVSIAVDMVDEGLIDKKEAVLRVEPEQLDQLLHPMIDPKAQEGGARQGPARRPRAPPAARSSSPPTRPRLGQGGQEGHPRPHRDQSRRTSAAWTSPRASSPPAAA